MREDLALFGLRVALGSVFITHACDKLGWYSISLLWEINDLLKYFEVSLTPFTNLVGDIFNLKNTDKALWLASIAASTELLAGCLLVLGFFSRFAGLCLTLLMSVAVYYHFPNGFHGYEGGYEWAMLCLAGSQAIMFLGAGRISLTSLLQAITTEQSKAL